MPPLAARRGEIEAMMRLFRKRPAAEAGRRLALEKVVQRDISRFIPANEQKSLQLWNRELFLDAVTQFQD
jgi:hypothetical protein